MLAVKADDLSSIPRTHTVGRTLVPKLSLTSTCELWHTYSHTINVIFKEREKSLIVLPRLDFCSQAQVPLVLPSQVARATGM